MEKISNLKIENFRSHEFYDISFHNKVTIITGNNGIGKTSILEAIYIMLRGKSFKGVDGDIIKRQKEYYSIKLSFSNGLYRTCQSRRINGKAKKKFVIEDKTSTLLGNKNKLPIILFEPDDLNLISGSPSRRRAFIDNFISSYDLDYEDALKRYEKALKQRNAILKQEVIKEDDLFVWNVALSRYGSVIIAKRDDFLREINLKLTNEYRHIAKNKDIIVLDYKCTIDIKKENIAQLLINSYQKDRILGHTSVGPHLDDFDVYLNSKKAVNSASRGENRSIILALKSIESDIIYQKTRKRPLILLDDVFSELDELRQKQLLNIFKDCQIVLTSVNGINIDNSLEYHLK